jgi:glutamine cyclotransferase
VFAISKHGRVNYKYINELEYANNKLFANIWLTNSIVVIDPLKGEIEKVVDFTLLTQYEKNISQKRGDVLNGIAYDKFTNR